MSRDFDRKRDADAFEAEVRRRRPARRSRTHRCWMRESRRSQTSRGSGGRLTPSRTSRQDARLYASASGIDTFCRDSEALSSTADSRSRSRVSRPTCAGKGVGEPTIRKTLTLLQGILQRAVVWGRIPSNPVAPIRKPTQRRQRSSPPYRRATSRDSPHAARRTARRTRRSCRCSPTPACGRAKRSHCAGGTSRSGRSSSSAPLARRGQGDEDRATRTVRTPAPLAEDLARVADQWPSRRRRRSSSRHATAGRGTTTTGATGAARLRARGGAGLDRFGPTTSGTPSSRSSSPRANDRRRRAPGRALADDGARHLRPRDRGARGERENARRRT